MVLSLSLIRQITRRSCPFLTVGQNCRPTCAKRLCFTLWLPVWRLLLACESVRELKESVTAALVLSCCCPNKSSSSLARGMILKKNALPTGRAFFLVFSLILRYNGLVL